VRREGDGSQVSIPVDERTFLRFSLRGFKSTANEEKKRRERKEEINFFRL
jgi:hypothetical protein